MGVVKNILLKLFRKKQSLKSFNYMISDCECQFPCDRLGANKFILSEVILEISKIIGIHPFPFDELLLMACAFVRVKPDVVLDLGTYKGHSSRFFYEISRILQHKCEINTVDILDPDHPENPGEALGHYIRNTSVIQHIGDSFEKGKELISSKPDKKYLIFVDAEHDFEYVRRDLDLLTMVKKGSGALLHDAFYVDGGNVDVKLAAEDYIKTNPVKQYLNLDLGLPGMIYIEK